MTRSGIYVNGKEIVARYVGDKLVWKKSREQLLTTISYSKPWLHSFAIDSDYVVELVEYFKTSITNSIEFDITRVSIGSRSWIARKYYLAIEQGYTERARVITRLIFASSEDKNSFINYTNMHTSGEIKVYKEK